MQALFLVQGRHEKRFVDACVRHRPSPNGLDLRLEEIPPPVRLVRHAGTRLRFGHDGYFRRPLGTQYEMSIQ